MGQQGPPSNQREPRPLQVCGPQWSWVLSRSPIPPNSGRSVDPQQLYAADGFWFSALQRWSGLGVAPRSRSVLHFHLSRGRQPCVFMAECGNHARRTGFWKAHRWGRYADTKNGSSRLDWWQGWPAGGLLHVGCRPGQDPTASRGAEAAGGQVARGGEDGMNLNQAESMRRAHRITMMLSAQFWPMWSKSRQSLGQLPIGRTTLSGWMDGWETVSHSWSPLVTSTASAKIGKTAIGSYSHCALICSLAFRTGCSQSVVMRTYT